MKRFMTRSQILRNKKMTEDELDSLIPDLTAHVFYHDNEEHTAYYEDQILTYIAQRDIKPEKYTHLSRELGMTEAALEYKINPSTIYRWVAKGKIPVTRYEGNRKMLREADVAYYVDLSRNQKMRQGKKIL